MACPLSGLQYPRRTPYRLRHGAPWRGCSYHSRYRNNCRNPGRAAFRRCDHDDTGHHHHSSSSLKHNPQEQAAGYQEGAQERGHKDMPLGFQDQGDCRPGYIHAYHRPAQGWFLRAHHRQRQRYLPCPDEPDGVHNNPARQGNRHNHQGAPRAVPQDLYV